MKKKIGSPEAKLRIYFIVGPPENGELAILFYTQNKNSYFHLNIVCSINMWIFFC